MTVSKIPSDVLLRRCSLGDKEAIETLRSDMQELSIIVARHFADYEPVETLAAIGMTHFHSALDHYLAHLASSPDPRKLYKFSTYFAWWIRESIKTYLGLSLRPISGILPRNKSA